MNQIFVMAHTNTPANNTSGFKIQYSSYIDPHTHEPDVSEVLNPGGGFYHPGIALAVLRPTIVLKISVGLQSISRSGNLCYTRFSSPLLSSFGNRYTSQVTYSSGFLFSPVKLNGETSYAVVGISLVDCPKLFNGNFIPLGQFGRFAVET